ncbi:MAG TPA: DNA polymerase III subunit delta' [Mycobacteriales bacterium]|nr:DNA polymerase III subunit delta' [Mycobacteriales bacterium]
MNAYDGLIDQGSVIARLTEAVASAADELAGRLGASMTHAWLFTGPPGSGRSVAARAFATALQCPSSGCGDCHSCRTVQVGTHPDVDHVVPEGLHLSIRETREIVSRAARSPSLGRWQITVIEDADRMEDRTGNTLLRAIEEPPPRGVFLLCAPSPEDLLPTIRSRCRLISLRLPSVRAVTDHLVRREGVDRAIAQFAAQAAGGHVGRARWLARDEQGRARRRDVLAIPAAVATVPRCFAAAEALVAAADNEAAAATVERDASELSALEVAMGVGGSRRPRGSAGTFKDLEDAQRSRLTRSKRDALDRALTDLAGFYRDVLVLQLGRGSAPVPLTCADLGPALAATAAATTTEASLRRIEAILDARAAIEANVAPLLAVESMLLALHAS